MSEGKKKDELRELKRQVRKLKGEIAELKKIVCDYMAAPQKAVLAFFGISPTEEVIDGYGLGVEYKKIAKKVSRWRELEEKGLLKKVELPEEVAEACEVDFSSQE